VHFILLTGSRAVIAGRMAARKGHFMPTALLDSQFATLELPGSDENAVTLDVAQSIEALVDQAFTAVSGKSTQKENK
jgi:gluconokinase